MENIKASILIANFNSSKYIDQCINSLKSQTYKNYEIIFFDDNSTDNSIETIKKYKDIKIIENKKQTSYGSLNQINAYKTAYEQSSGDILFFLDADDYFRENKLEKIIDRFSNKSNKKIIFDYPIIFNNEKFVNIKKKTKFFKTYWPYIHPQSCISFRRVVANDIFKSINYQKYTDVWMDFRICLFSQYLLKEMNVVDENLTFYRQTDTNISSGFKRFSGNWWKRRKEAHSYLLNFAKDNNFKVTKNLDFLVTNLMNFFI